MKRIFLLVTRNSRLREVVNSAIILPCDEVCTRQQIQAPGIRVALWACLFARVSIHVMIACLCLLTFLVAPARSQDGRQVVVNLDYVIRDSAASSNPCPSGWEWSNTDLNRSLNFRSGVVTAGKYIYACYQRQAWTPFVSPITDITFTVNDDDGNRCDPGSTWINKDLNDEAGGDTPYIYTCVRRDGSSPVLDLKAIEGFVGLATCGRRWRGNSTDLNAGTSFTRSSPYPTAFLYMCVQDTRSAAEAYDCGGENERPCGRGTFTFDETAFFANGNFGCDRGLREIDGRCKNAGNALSRRHSDVDDFNNSWTQWAMTNQRNQLALDEPLNWVLTIQAHNGYNNLSDAYFLDPNHKYSFTDQLRLGVRNLSPDVVWDEDQLRLCHTLDGNCSPSDRFYSNSVKEIANWLSENPDEVITITLEDRYDLGHGGDEIYLWGPLSTYLGNKVLKRSDFASVVPSCVRGGEVQSFNECRWPTRREMLRAGKQVILFGHDKDRSTDWIWPKAKLQGKGSDATSFNYDTCKSAEDPGHFWDGNLTNWNSVGEDRTTFGAVAGLADRDKWIGFIDQGRTEKLVRCGASRIALDFVHAAGSTQALPCGTASDLDNLSSPCPNPDNRLKATVWSWAENNLGSPGDRAVYSFSSERWVSHDSASQRHHFVCGKPREGDPLNWSDPRGDQWVVTSAVGLGSEGNRICEQEFGNLGLVYAVPMNGFQNEQLRAALGGARSRPGFDHSSSDVWLNYRKGADGNWLRDRGPVAVLNGLSEVSEGQTETYTFEVTEDGIDDNSAIEFNLVNADCGAFAQLEPGSLQLTQQGGQFQCRFIDNKTIGAGNPNITVRVANAQGAVRMVSFTPSVSNVAPALASIQITPQIDENGTATLTGSIIDPGVRDNLLLTVKWRESEPAQTYNYPAGTTSFQLTRQYLDDDPTNTPSDVFSISVLVTDDSNDNSGLASVPISVRNLAPVVSMNLTGLYRTAVGSSVVPTRIPISLSGSFTDVGSLDTHTPLISWGDASPGVASLNGTHEYTSSGVMTVSLSVTDDDQGIGVKSSPIEVAAPTRAATVAGVDLRQLAARSDLSATARAAIHSAITDLFGSVTGQTKAGAVELLGTGVLDSGVDKIRQAVTTLTNARELPADLNLTPMRTFLAVSARSVAQGEIVRVQAAATKPDDRARLQEAMSLVSAGDSFLRDGLHIKAVERFLAAVVKVKNIR